MSVYVDNARIRYRSNWCMSHIIADSLEELLEMVDAIGVSRSYLQAGGTRREHLMCACLSGSQLLDVARFLSHLAS